MHLPHLTQQLGISSFDTSLLLFGTFFKKLQFVVLNRTLAIRKWSSLNCRAWTSFKTRIIQWGWETSAQNTSLSLEKADMMVSKCYLYQMSQAIYLLIHSFEWHHSFLPCILVCHCNLLSPAAVHWNNPSCMMYLNEL